LVIFHGSSFLLTVLPGLTCLYNNTEKERIRYKKMLHDGHGKVFGFKRNSSTPGRLSFFTGRELMERPRGY
jgi:hypothetical protein